MSESERLAFITRVMAFTYIADIREELSWSVTDGVVQFWINCSDLFVWGCADSEELGPDTFEELELACRHADKVGAGACFGAELYCCRMSKMRPQGAAYAGLPLEMWHLLDACGQEREVGLGNPRPRPKGKDKIS